MGELLFYGFVLLVISAVIIVLITLFTGAPPAIPGTGVVPTPPATFPGR